MSYGFNEATENIVFMVLQCEIWFPSNVTSVSCLVTGVETKSPRNYVIVRCMGDISRKMYCVLLVVSCVILAAMHALMENVCAFDVEEAVLVA